MNPLLSAISRYGRRPHIARGKTRTNQRNKQRQRLHLEVLEDRLALAGYSLTDLGTPPGFDIINEVSNINNSGQIAVIAADKLGGQGLEPFLYSNGKWTDLGEPSSTEGSGFLLINNAGQILYTWHINNSDHAFLYSNGKWTDLGLPNGFTYIEGEGLNDSGQVIGYAADKNGYSHTFLYSDGQWTDLGALTAWGINNSGQIVGDVYYATSQKDDAFLYSNGKLTDLGTPNGSPDAGFVFINNSGEIVASAAVGSEGGEDHAFLYSNGQWTDLGTPDGLPYTTAYGINSSGQVVGLASNLSQQNPQQIAFLYSNGKMADLNSLLPAGTSESLGNASGINDNGQIVAQGSAGHAYLLTPQQATGIAISNGTVSPNTLTVSNSGQQVTVSATIDDNGSPATAGNVVFSLVGPKGTVVSDGTTSVAVGSNGQASDALTVPAGTAAGSYSLQVAYTNNSQTQTQSFAGGLSINAILVNVALSGIAPTQFVAGTNAQQVTATATVTLASGNGVVSEGTVTFTLLNGVTPIGQSIQVPVINGTAQLTSDNPFVVPANTPAGSYTLRAAYSDPAGSFGASQPATAKLTITSAASTAPPSTPPNLIQAVDAVFLDGIVLAIDLLLGQDMASVQASLDANLPYAGPAGVLFELLGMEAVFNALQANNNT